MSQNPLHSDNDDDSWLKGFETIEYKDDDNDLFGEDPLNDFFAPKHNSVTPIFQINSSNQDTQSGHSIDSINSSEFNARRTISSPLIALTPPPPQIFSPQVQFQIPGVQTTFNFSQSKISRLLAPVDTQARAQEDQEFINSLRDTSLVVSPHGLGFIPYSLWHDRTYTFGELVTDFFQRKNHASCRFSYKLYNSLKLSQINERYAFLCGVCWLNNLILRVDKRAFARLLGIKSIDGSLFHQQGNFPSHGFIEISAEEVPKICPDVNLTGVDFDSVRLLYHAEGIFVRAAQESDLATCKWASVRK